MTSAPANSEAEVYLRFIQRQLRELTDSEDQVTSTELSPIIAQHFAVFGYSDAFTTAEYPTHIGPEPFDTIVEQLFAKVRAVTKPTPALNTVAVGTLHTGHVNALAFPLPNRHGVVIAFENQLPHLANLTSKAIASVIEFSPPSSFRLSSTVRATPKVAEILKAFVTTGNLAYVTPFLAPPDRFAVAYSLCNAFETFVMAHEVAHVVLGHLDHPSMQQVSGLGGLPVLTHGQGDEMAADALGLLLTLKTLEADLSVDPFILAGIQLFFETTTAIESCITAAAGTEIRNLHATHPPNEMRIGVLHHLLRETIPSGLATGMIQVAEWMARPVRDAATHLAEFYASAGRDSVHWKLRRTRE